MKSLVNNSFCFREFTKELLLLIAIVLGAYGISSGQSVTEIYKRANELYKSNQFEQAAENYERIISQGYKNAELYYNLGNCYYKLNSVGKSILAYERALKLSSKDDDIIHNLKLAELKRVDKTQPVPQLAIITRWNNFISAESSKGWGVFALVAIWVAVLVYTIFFFIGSSKMLNPLALLFLLLSIGFLFLAIGQRQSEKSFDEAILMVSSTVVKSAPDASASDLFIIHEGVKLKILDQVGTWNKIRLADGKIGWLEKGSFEKI